jgi:hypothetical protein
MTNFDRLLGARRVYLDDNPALRGLYLIVSDAQALPAAVVYEVTDTNMVQCGACVWRAPLSWAGLDAHDLLERWRLVDKVRDTAVQHMINEHGVALNR